MSKNYKRMGIKDLQKLITSEEFYNLSDEDAFSIMQRYNELKGQPQLEAENKLSKVELGNITIDIMDNNIT